MVLIMTLGESFGWALTKISEAAARLTFDKRLPRRAALAQKTDMQSYRRLLAGAVRHWGRILTHG